MNCRVISVLGSRGQFLKKKFELGNCISLIDQKATLYKSGSYIGNMHIAEVSIGEREIVLTGIVQKRTKQGYMKKRLAVWVCIPEENK